jgi:transposase-like protein
MDDPNVRFLEQNPLGRRSSRSTLDMLKGDDWETIPDISQDDEDLTLDRLIGSHRAALRQKPVDLADSMDLLATEASGEILDTTGLPADYSRQVEDGDVLLRSLASRELDAIEQARAEDMRLAAEAMTDSMATTGEQIEIYEPLSFADLGRGQDPPDKAVQTGLTAPNTGVSRKNGGWTIEKIYAAAYVSMGHSVERIAAQLNIPKQTLLDWKREEQFAKYVDAILDNARIDAYKFLQGHLVMAARIVTAIARSGTRNDDTRLRASTWILEKCKVDFASLQADQEQYNPKDLTMAGLARVIDGEYKIKPDEPEEDPWILREATPAMIRGTMESWHESRQEDARILNQRIKTLPDAPDLERDSLDLARSVAGDSSPPRVPPVVAPGHMGTVAALDNLREVIDSLPEAPERAPVDIPHITPVEPVQVDPYYLEDVQIPEVEIAPAELLCYQMRDDASLLRFFERSMRTSRIPVMLGLTEESKADYERQRREAEADSEIVIGQDQKPLIFIR